MLVTEMAKLQARTVGGTEDYVVTREFAALASEQQRIDVLRACFAVGRGEWLDLGGGVGGGQPDRQGARSSTPHTVNEIRAEFHERLSSVQAVRRIAEGR